MGGKEKEGRVGGRGKGGEGKGEKMWRDPESGLPRGPCWLSAGLPLTLSATTQARIKAAQSTVLVPFLTLYSLSSLA